MTGLGLAMSVRAWDVMERRIFGGTQQQVPRPPGKGGGFGMTRVC